MPVPCKVQPRVWHPGDKRRKTACAAFCRESGTRCHNPATAAVKPATVLLWVDLRADDPNRLCAIHAAQAQAQRVKLSACFQTLAVHKVVRKLLKLGLQEFEASEFAHGGAKAFDENCKEELTQVLAQLKENALHHPGVTLRSFPRKLAQSIMW